MINIYPVTKTEITCSDYIVKVNGTEVSLDTARVSAAPINRRWPGHQRTEDQSELINFLSMSTDEAIEFEITPKEPFENVIIRPLSLGIVPEVEDGVIRFTLEKPAYFTVEPYKRSKALHIFCDPIENKFPLSSEVIYFGKGEHDIGQITLKSNQTLYLDEGAVVYACIQATDAENIKIAGRGILDNSRNKEQILYDFAAEGNDVAIDNATRQHTIQLEYCTNVAIDGITIRDSLVYNVRPVGCKNLHIKNVKIIGCWRYNSDGIDMHNCEDVLIENCFIRTFDDSICVKGFDCYYEGDVEKAVHAAMYRNGKAYDVFKNTVIRNCTIWNDWGKSLEIGAETRAEEIFNIVFEECDIIHVTGMPLDCYNVDYADVHHITYQNINVEYDENIPPPMLQERDDDTYRNHDPNFAPYLICAITEFHHEYSAGGTRRGTNRDITFKNIHYFGRQKPTFYFKGCDEEHKTKDVLIENLYWNGNLVTSLCDEQLIKDSFTENIQFIASV